MYLSDALGLIHGDYNLTETEKIIILLAIARQDEFCSLDFFCKNILTNYRSLDQKFQKDRVRITTKITHLFDYGKIEKRMPPFDTSERIEFAKKVYGGIINDGPRKTISVFKLTPKGWEEFKELRNKIQTSRMLCVD